MCSFYATGDEGKSIGLKRSLYYLSLTTSGVWDRQHSLMKTKKEDLLLFIKDIQELLHSEEEELLK